MIRDVQEIFVQGRVRYLVKAPDLRGKTVLLQPELSPIENCWRIVRLQALIWLAKYRVWSAQQSDLEELIQDAQIAVFNELKRRVRLGQYDRSRSFWLNVRSCAFAVVGSHVVRVWQNKVNRRSAIEDATEIYKSTTSGFKFRTDSDDRQELADSWDPKARKCTRVMVAKRVVEDAYDKYVEDCIEFGVKDRMGKVEWILSNYGDTEAPELLGMPKATN